MERKQGRNNTLQVISFFIVCCAWSTRVCFRFRVAVNRNRCCWTTLAAPGSDLVSASNTNRTWEKTLAGVQQEIRRFLWGGKARVNPRHVRGQDGRREVPGKRPSRAAAAEQRKRRRLVCGGRDPRGRRESCRGSFSPGRYRAGWRWFAQVSPDIERTERAHASHMHTGVTSASLMSHCLPRSRKKRARVVRLHADLIFVRRTLFILRGSDCSAYYFFGTRASSSILICEGGSDRLSGANTLI